LQPVQVAANTEASKPFKLPISVEHGQTRHFGGQAFVGITERPKQDNTAEGFPRCEGVCDLSLWIEIECLCNLKPAAAKYGGRSRSQQISEFLICKAEVSACVGLPNKAEGKMVQVHCRCRRNRFCWSCRCRCVLAEIGARGRRRGSEDDKQGKSRARAEFKNVDLAASDLAGGPSV